MTRTGLAFSLLFIFSISCTLAAEVKRDPTRPLVDTSGGGLAVGVKRDAAPAVKKNQLKGIILNNNHRKAIIDGQLVAVGQRINGFIVHQISAQKVILRSGSTYKTLTLSPSVKTVNKQG